jgi:hypothetical protein
MWEYLDPNEPPRCGVRENSETENTSRKGFFQSDVQPNRKIARDN